MTYKTETVGIAGVGALGSIVAKALVDGIQGYELKAVSNLAPVPLTVPNVGFEELADQCDIIIECLPAAAVPVLADAVLRKRKTLILTTSCALVLYPEISTLAREGFGRIIVPTGALAGLDGVLALSQDKITKSTIITTKPPQSFANNDYVAENKIELSDLRERVMIFSGSVVQAAKIFPANVNVAASLALAGIGPELTRAEIWADPAVTNNSHEIIVEGRSSRIQTKVQNLPDPANPKSSRQAAFSIISALKKRNSYLTIY